MELLRKILSNTIYHIVSILLCAGAVYGAYYLRKVMQYSFKTIYYGGYVLLILSFLVFLITYKDKCEEKKALVKESLSGYFFFVAFFIITFILRG